MEVRTYLMKAGSNQSLSDFEQKITNEPSIETMANLDFILFNRKVLAVFLKNDLSRFLFFSSKPISIAK